MSIYTRVINPTLRAAYGGLLLLAASAMTVQAQESEQTIHFKWAFVTMSGPSLNPRLTPIHGDTTLAGGSRVKMLVEIGRQMAPKHVYVVIHGATSGIKTLLPYALTSPEALQPGRYYLPRGPGWFTLDRGAGEDVMYVLASREALTGLEALLRKVVDTPAAERPAVEGEIVGEIRSLIRQHRSFARRAERPVSIAGQVRNAQMDVLSDIVPFAQEVSAESFYFKSYTITHE